MLLPRTLRVGRGALSGDHMKNDADSQPMQVQALSARSVPANPEVVAPSGTSKLITNAKTAKTPIGSRKVWTEWNGELMDGSGNLPTSAPGPFTLDSGWLYIVSQSYSVPAAPAQVAAPVPVVVHIGTVRAGSVGTHWLVMRDNGYATPTSWIIFVRGSGPIEVWNAPAVVGASITAEMNYLELPNHTLPAGAQQAHIDAYQGSYPNFATKVREAIERSICHYFP